MSDDWMEFLHAMLEAHARFLVVGAHEDQEVQIGVAPNRIDILTSLSGLSKFEDAWKDRLESNVGGQLVPFIGREQLIATKRATHRTKDLADIEALDAGRT